jgi:hypothetical protein
LDVSSNWNQPDWKPPEPFVGFVFKTLVRLGLLILLYRYAVGADLTEPPWRLLGVP